ncbi:cytochrome P450 130 [Arthrobacter sp. Hiyo8]|nr:cytochrome P450 130 [Arthrobacter sp. Hiyo8]
MTAPIESDIDIWADDILVDPYPTYAALREQASVVHLPKNELYVLTRYDAIRNALGDPEAFSSTSIGFNPMVNQALQGTSLASDPPIHTQLRATLSQNLTPGPFAASKSSSTKRRTSSSRNWPPVAASRPSMPWPGPSRSRSSPILLVSAATSRTTCCAGARPRCKSSAR